MNAFFTFLITICIFAFILIGFVTLYQKITHKTLFHFSKLRIKRTLLSSLLVFCVAIFGYASTDPQPLAAAPPAKTIYKVDVIGKKELTAAKLKAYQLAKTSSKVSSQAESVKKLAVKSSSASESRFESVATASSKSASRASASKETHAASESKQHKQASQSAAQARSQAASSRHNGSSATTTQASHTTSQGNLNTAKQSKIVGNKNSHIYHVPGQAGYHMNAKNAVYFQTEAQAQSSGYRKAKR
ncbi:DNA-entry nuclease [Pediococcus siamensis]|uniref:sunset domain-containing protein n=1 Tax=Pediococcus siamensis TaxID=381829 RepID=UPI0039A13AEB